MVARIIRLLCRTFAVACLIAASARADLSSDRPGKGGPPTKVAIGFYINDIHRINDVNETFQVDFYLNLKWKDPRLAGKDKQTTYKAENIWQPPINIINQISVQSRSVDELTVDPDGTVYYWERFLVQLTAHMNLARFPFDTHPLAVMIEPFPYASDEVVFVIDSARTGWPKGFSVPDWKIRTIRANVSESFFAPEKAKYSRLICAITASRRYAYYVWKIIIPLILIVIVSWSVFWISIKEIGTQLTVAVTAMLTVVAFHFLVSGDLPQIAYQTRLDRYILICYIIVFLAVLESVITHILDSTERTNAARRVAQVSRLVFPVAFALSLALTLAL